MVSTIKLLCVSGERFVVTVGFGAGLKFVVISFWFGLESLCLVAEDSGCLGENPVLA